MTFAPSNHVTARDGAMRPRRLAGPARVAPGSRLTIRAALADVAGLIGLGVAVAGAAILMAAAAPAAVVHDDSPPWMDCRPISWAEGLARAEATPLDRADLGPERVGPWVGSRPRDIFDGLMVHRTTRLDVVSSRKDTATAPAPVPIGPIGSLFGLLLGGAAGVLMMKGST